MSASPQDTFDRVAELTELYLCDEISDDQLAELEALVRGDEQAAVAMRTVFNQAGMMRVVFNEQQQFANRIGETNSDEYLALMQELSPREEPATVTLLGELPADPASLSGHDFAVVGDYVLRKVFTNKKVITTGICSAAAAVLLLALILINPFANDTPEPIAIVPEVPTQTPDQPNTVATLTAERDAQWKAASGTMLPALGDELHAGQWLTLTDGVVEVTTARGAVAVLEAPCQIELLSDNSLYLHRGKLVGICETELSKRFLVLTPHMGVTDLGTRFGVAVNHDDKTEVHVTSGEVAVTWEHHAQVEHRVVAGEALVANADPTSVERGAADLSQFAVISPAVIPLRGTGVGLAAHEADPLWWVVSEQGQSLEPAQSLRVSNSEGHIRDLPNDPASSQWIAWTPSINPIDSRAIDYQIQTSIEIPDSMDLGTASLQLKVAADNRLAAVIVNGQRVPVKMASRDSWDALEPLTINEHLESGENTIVFEVQNISFDGDPAHIIGLRLTWELHGQTYQLGDDTESLLEEEESL